MAIFSVWYKRFQVLHKILVRLCYRLFSLLPIDKNLVLFESERDFCDNSWVLYQYLLKHRAQYHFVWLCYDRRTLKQNLGNSRTKFYLLHGLRGAWYLSRAKYIFYTHGLGGALRREGQFVLNLWHGIAIKGLKSISPTQEFPFFNYLLCLGKKNIATQAAFLSCRKDIVIPLGYPRNDLLLDNLSSGYLNPFSPTDFRGKLILWMPTFRASINSNLSQQNVDTETGLPLLVSEEMIKNFDEILHEMNVVILVKIHHLQEAKVVFSQKYANIIFLTDQDLQKNGLQLYQIVGKSDALISDYSSIAIDYLLVDKPMGFILDDMDMYAKSRGAFLYEDIRTVLGGHHIYTLDELQLFIQEIAEGKDSKKAYRHQVLSEMIEYPDNQSCQRIVEFCKM